MHLRNLRNALVTRVSGFGFSSFQVDLRREGIEHRGSGDSLQPGQSQRLVLSSNKHLKPQTCSAKHSACSSSTRTCKEVAKPYLSILRRGLQSNRLSWAGCMSRCRFQQSAKIIYNRGSILNKKGNQTLSQIDT